MRIKTKPKLNANQQSLDGDKKDGKIGNNDIKKKGIQIYQL